MPESNSWRIVSEYRSGYPQFAALLDVHPAFQSFRRFSRTRLRLLLLKQDEIACLEVSLDSADAHEQSPLSLGCVRKDDNPERRMILEKLQVALAQYGR